MIKNNNFANSDKKEHLNFYLIIIFIKINMNLPFKTLSESNLLLELFELPKTEKYLNIIPLMKVKLMIAGYIYLVTLSRGLNVMLARNMIGFTKNPK